MMFRFALFLCCIHSYISHAKETETSFLGVGLATIDLLIQVDDDFLSKHLWSNKGGSWRGNSLLIEDIIAASGSEVKTVSGGSSANTIRALAKLGEKCSFFSCVGEDLYGEKFCKDLSEIGVDGKIVKIENTPTSHVLCMISSDGQRTFIGCDPILDVVLPKKEDLAGVQWLHMESRQFNCDEMAMKILQMARSQNIKISLSLSGSDVIQKHREKLNVAISQYADIVFCNEEEIFELTGLPPMEGCLRLLDDCPLAVVTMGSDGCIVGYEKTVVHVPAFPAQAIDTTGAGDFFAAGFLYGYFNGKSAVISAQIGHCLGGAVIEVIGADLPESNWDAVREAIGKYL